jgi:hypothetical protein
MADNLMMALAEIIGKECQNQVSRGKELGSQKYHIESLRRIKNPDGSESPFLFEITTWTEESCDPRETLILDYPNMIEKLGSAIIWAAFYDAAMEIRKHKAE